MTKKINLIFMGRFTYPRGMAGTKRIQNTINAMKEYPGVAIRVVLLRQSSEENKLSGMHEGTPYQTVMGDLLRTRMFFMLPILYYKTITTLKKAFRFDHKNIVYFYGPLFIDSVVPIQYAQKLGYKIVFDVTEDYGLTDSVSRSFFQYFGANLAHGISSRIRSLASGIIVISSYLEERYKKIFENNVPVHYLPISVDINKFHQKATEKKEEVSLFYAGSFGKKDGLPVLLDAFDSLAAKYHNIRLVLTGQGDASDLKEFISRKERSPYGNRIDFKGYLDENEYYAVLNDADIPCMTRVDLAFAHAGFPFKLGEFLATGKPVIASRVSDIDRYLVNGHSAMLVNAGSSTEICSAVEYLMNNPEDAAAIGARGRDVSISFFDYRKQGRDLLDFLENL